MSTAGEAQGARRSERWLTLGQASRLLGVHRSTLRRWADDGRIDCRRTAGGHRRFDRRLLEARIGASDAGAEPSSGSDAPGGGELPTPAWQEQIRDAGQVDQLREMGQRLSGIVLQYLSKRDQDDRRLAEARALGHDYARHAQRAGMDRVEAVEAFLYYRAGSLRMLMNEAERGEDGLARYQRYDQVVSAVLMGLIRGYQEEA